MNKDFLVLHGGLPPVLMSQKGRSPSPGRQIYHPGIAPVADCRRTSVGRSKKNETSSTVQSNEAGQIPFGDSWSVINVNGFTPPLRIGQSILYSESTSSILFAYGQNLDDSYSSSVYKFSLIDYSWSVVNIPNLSPRAGCGSVIVGNRIWFFGGSTQKSFVRDLHYLDLDSMTITYPPTTGEIPPACTFPLLAYSHPNLIVWASMTGSNPSSLHVLNTNTGFWREIPTEQVYRQGSCGRIVNNNLYIFGASCPNTILTLGLADFDFSVVQTTGEEPTHGLESLTTTQVGKNLLTLSTIGDDSLNQIYSFDTERSTWSRFTINQTSIEAEPIIVFYLEKQRKLLLILQGSQDSGNIFAELPIGKPMSRVNLRLDLLNALSPIGSDQI